MAYNLQAIIGRRSVLERHAGDFGKVRVASLRQGFGLIPLFHDLWEQICGVEPEEPRFRAMVLKDKELPTPFSNWMERVSLDGAVAYVEGECDAGPCDQAAIVWRGGEIVLGPVRYEEGVMNDDVRERKDRSGDGAINVVLRFLGAERRWSIDEFDALGLGGRRRWTEDWIEKGGIVDAPDAEANDRLASFLRERGKWLGLAPDRLASLTFKPDPNAVDAARRTIADGGVDALDLGPAGPLKMPVAMTLADVEVVGFAPESGEKWPLVYLAAEGLDFVRWAACGAEAVLKINPEAWLWVYVTGGVARVTKRGVYGWIEVPYEDLSGAWQRFSEEVRDFLVRELPELAGHAICGKWLRDGISSVSWPPQPQ